jgi:hypothetical protein
MGGASYSPFDPFQSTENANELNQSYRAIRAGASSGLRYGRFRTRIPVVESDVIARMNLQTSRSADVGYRVFHSSLG